MAQHRRATFSEQDSGHLHQKEDSQVRALAREVPFFNRGAGLRHFLSPTYNPLLSWLTFTPVDET